MDIICFSETWLSPRKRIQLGDLQMEDKVEFRLDRYDVPGFEDESHGGLMMLVKSEYNPVRVEVRLSCLEALVVSVHTQTKSLNVVCVYRQPNGISIETLVTKFKHILMSLPSFETIIIGDMNIDTLSAKRNTFLQFMSSSN